MENEDFRCLDAVFVQNDKNSEDKANVIDIRLILQSFLAHTTLCWFSPF